MFLYLVLFAVLCVPVTLQSPTVKMRSFLAERNCDNRISSKELIAEHQTPSRRSCAAMCDVNCKCFGFNSMVKRCRIHHSCDPVYMTSVEDGWNYYQIDGNYFIKFTPKQTWTHLSSKCSTFIFSILSIKNVTL